MRNDAQRRPKTRKQKILKLFLKTCKINRRSCRGPGRIQKNPQNSDPKPYISLSKILLILIRIVWVLAPYFHPWKSRYEFQLHRVFSTVEAFSEQIKAKFWFLRKSKTKIWLRSFSLFRENTQNRVQPPKTSPIEQISYRWEPKFSPLQRVTLQSLKSCYCWSILLKESVSNLAPASAQNQPKIWKYARKLLIFSLYFLTF